MAGDMRRPRLGRLDAIGELMPGESNELTTGTVIDIGGVQVCSQVQKHVLKAGVIGQDCRKVEPVEHLREVSVLCKISVVCSTQVRL